MVICLSYQWSTSPTHPRIIPAVSLTQARDAAREAAVEVRSGIDPAMVKVKSKTRMTLGKLFEEYEEAHGKRISSMKERMRVLRNDSHEWLNLPVEDLTRHMVHVKVQEILKRARRIAGAFQAHL